MKTYFANSLESELSEKMRIGAKVVFYEDHLKAIAEKDALIKSLAERVHKYMAKYPNGASGCACLFDDNDVAISACSYHADKDRDNQAKTGA